MTIVEKFEWYKDRSVQDALFNSPWKKYNSQVDKASDCFHKLDIEYHDWVATPSFTLHSSRKALCVDVKQDLKEPLDLTIDCQFTLGLVFSKHEPKFMMRLFEREESTWIDDVTSNWQRKTLQIKGHR